MKTPDLVQRQIHLDFHTSPLIPGVGQDFDARTFARTMQAAHVESVTVFAKCHHGHLYYATRHPARHPTLPPRLDLLGGQVKALHALGIRAPIYISVLLDEFAAAQHPEWVARRPDGTTVGGGPLQAAWRVMDMAGPYQEYLADQVREVLHRFQPVDGIFFDICFDVESCTPAALSGMTREGLDPESPEDRKRYAASVTQAYLRRFSRMVVESSPRATVYFNSRPLGGLTQDLRWMTHVEIEALPTGGWGYLYFPKNVRYARTFGRPTMGMTARFHKSWADFGGLKPTAALRYEVSQMLAHGSVCSIGDQMHPRGVLDPAAYQLIGDAYAHAEACEPWTKGARPVAQIGVFMTGLGQARYHEEPGGSNDGAVRMLSQLKHQFDLIGADAPLERYRLVILPDSIPVDEDLAGRLRAFLKGGGSLLLSGTSGLDAQGQPVLREAGVRANGMSPFAVSYVRLGNAISHGAAATDHVMYEPSVRILPAAGASVLAKVVEPYFDRTWRHFSSHHQTPPRPEASRWAAVVRKASVISIAYPIFKLYGTHANLAARSLVENCIRLLLPDRLVEIDAPSAAEVTVTRQGSRRIVHLLYYPADRRTADLDIAEDTVPLRNVPLSLLSEKPPRRVYCAPSGQPLIHDYGNGRVRVVVPVVEGHQMVVVE